MENKDLEKTLIGSDALNIDNLRISVCIPTYKRPLLLKRLLESLEEQILPEGVLLEIIVVDNDAEKTAEDIVIWFAENSVFECKYFSQPQKNISITRNMAVKNATGELLLFIDDDEYASPELVKEHLQTMQKYDADVVFGLVEPYFHNGTPEWLKDRDYYYSPMLKTGSDAKFILGGNTLIKASIIKQFEEPFDISYGITGGEDSHFYGKLMKSGYRLKTCREAVAMEFIPPERTTHQYLFTRAFKGGNSYVRRIADQNKNRRVPIYLEHFVKGGIQVIFYSVKYILLLFSRKKRFRSLLKIYANLGKVLAITGYTYKGYK